MCSSLSLSLKLKPVFLILILSDALGCSVTYNCHFDGTRGIIYNHNMFIIHFVCSSVDPLNKKRGDIFFQVRSHSQAIVLTYLEVEIDFLMHLRLEQSGERKK